jgi:hypothetical protein
MTHSEDNIKNRKYLYKSKKGKSIKRKDEDEDEDDTDKRTDVIRSADLEKKYSKEESRLIKKYKSQYIN